MHAASSLHRCLDARLPCVHRRHHETLVAAVGACVSGPRLTLTDIGRRFASQASLRHGVKRADRDWARNTEEPRPVTRQSAATARVPDHGDESSPLLPSGSTSLLQARTVNEVVKAQTNKVRLTRLKGEVVDRAQAIAQVFRLARTERDAWLNWPAQIAAPLAASLGVDPHGLHAAPEAAVREHLQELGELRPRVD